MLKVKEQYAEQARRIRRDRDRIAERIKRETCLIIAKDYGVPYYLFMRIIQEAIGPERWEELVHTGRRIGSKPNNQTKDQQPEIDPDDNGPICWFCNKPIMAEDLICKACGTLL